MIYKELTMKELNPRLPETVNPATLTVFAQEQRQGIGYGEDEKHHAVVVLPGGGYRGLAEREADPITMQYLAAGYSVFLLRYSCAPDRYPNALLQVAATIAHIRQNFEEYHVDKIVTCGFSAGGHLSASAGILWNEPVISETLGIPNEMCKPDGMILSYPVITWGEKAHKGSFYNLLGEDAPEEKRIEMSLDGRVNSDTVPAFIWHTYQDAGVPVENSLYLAAAMRKNDIPFELHIFPEGPHGLALANRLTWNPGNDALINPSAEKWMEMSKLWINNL